MRWLFVLLLLCGCDAAKVSQPVVFLGDSITANWDLSTSFPGKNYVNKGVHSDTTAMMLARFDSDVLVLHPSTVVILGGTNDMTRSIPEAEHNIQAMVTKASNAGVPVIICTIPPIDGTPQGLGDLRSRVLEYNSDLKQMGAACDYFKVLAGPDDLPLPGVIQADGVHPTAQGYTLMTQVISPIVQ